MNLYEVYYTDGSERHIRAESFDAVLLKAKLFGEIREIHLILPAILSKPQEG